MDNFSTFKDVIAAWPSRKDFAVQVGVTLAQVNKMYEKDSIRGVYFQAIVEASKDFHSVEKRISAEDLVRIAARDRRCAA